MEQTYTPEQTAWGASLPEDEEQAMDMIETYLLERTKGGRQILENKEAPYRAIDASGDGFGV